MTKNERNTESDRGDRQSAAYGGCDGVVEGFSDAANAPASLVPREELLELLERKLASYERGHDLTWMMSHTREIATRLQDAFDLFTRRAVETAEQTSHERNILDGFRG